MKAIVTSVLLVSALFAPTTLLAQDAGARPISLDEAVRLARRNSPDAIAARNTVRSNAAAVRTRYAAFLPSLSFSSGVSKSRGSRYDNIRDEVVTSFSPWRGRHSFSAGIDIFNGGERFYELRRAKAQVDASEASEIAQSFTVALSVKQQYYAVLAARESESAARKQLEQAEQQLRAAVARVAAGAATRSDSLRSSIEVGNARLAILTAETQLNNANAALSRLVGSDDIVTAAVDSMAAETVSLTNSELLALADAGPAVQRSQASLTAAKAGRRSSWSAYLPNVSLSLSKSFQGQEDHFSFFGDPNLNNLSTSISVSLPLFNGLSREQSVVNARIAQENAEAELRDVRLNQRQLMIQQIGAFRTAEARVQIQLASVAAGEEDLRVQQERYNLGASTLLDLLTSQRTLDDARRALIQARLDARTAKAQIEALIGRDLQ